MTWVPVISRELRSEARHASAYWMRVVAAASAIGIALLGALQDWQGNWKGSDVFSVVQPTLFSLIWLLGPIMTCDSISRERREGTLGLLLLTGLRPRDVSLAKACSGIMRSLSIVLAVLPMLAVPLLLGGVSGMELVRAGLMDLMALLSVIAAGLLASSRCYHFSRAAALSLVYAGLALLILGNVQSVYFLVDHRFPGRPGSLEEYAVILVVGPWALCAGIIDIWRQTGRVLPATGYLWLSLVQACLALLFLLLVLQNLNLRLRSLAVEQGRTARQEWWWRVFCTPRFFTGWLQRRHQSLLNRNPIGWLQRRTWTARLSTWGWVGLVVVIETFVVVLSAERGSLADIRDPQLLLACLVAVGLAFSAADSFRAERETGALELLMVTPLRVRQIIMGRLFGIWGQYVLVFGLLAGMWFYTSTVVLAIRPWGHDLLNAEWLRILLLFLSTFLLLPLIGMHQSMRRKHFVTSWIITITLGLVIPLAIPASLLYAILRLQFQRATFFSPRVEIEFWGLLFLVALALQVVCAARAALHLYRNLDQRQFALRD